MSGTGIARSQPIPHREVLGTAEEWIAAVRECRALGVNVSGALGIHLLHHTQLPRYSVPYTARNAWNQLHRRPRVGRRIGRLHLELDV